MRASLAAILVLGALSLVACGQPVKAQVTCQEHTQGFACNVATQGGGSHNFEVCWDIKVTCGDGQKLHANTCQDVGGEAKASSVVPNAKFSGGVCKVGKVTGVAVENVKITKK